MQTTKVFFLALFVAMAAVACGGDEAEPRVTDEESSEPQTLSTYEDNDVAFEYPTGWDEFPAEASATSTGSNEIWSATVGPDKTNLVNITAYQLNIEVTEENIESIETELESVIQDVVDQAEGTITDGPTADEIAGYPAYTFTWEGVEVEGEPKDSSAYFVFNGDIEYFFNCQFSTEVEEEIMAGCQQILESFEVTNTA
jgi:hypothetical protein